MRESGSLDTLPVGTRLERALGPRGYEQSIQQWQRLNNDQKVSFVADLQRRHPTMSLSTDGLSNHLDAKTSRIQVRERVDSRNGGKLKTAAKVAAVGGAIWLLYRLMKGEHRAFGEAAHKFGTGIARAVSAVTPVSRLTGGGSVVGGPGIGFVGGGGASPGDMIPIR